MLLQNILDSLALLLLVGGSQDGQPSCAKERSKYSIIWNLRLFPDFQKLTDNSPKTVLLTDVVGSGTERLFSTNGETSSVHQVSKEFPTCQT